MDFSAREDIKAPIDTVFEAVTDFPVFERMMTLRGAEVERVADPIPAGVGTAWIVRFVLRGADRVVNAKVTTFDRPHQMELAATSKPIDATVQVDLMALSATTTRLEFTLSARPKTFAARLLFQSLRFARKRNQARLDGLIERFGREVAQRYSA